MTIAPYQIMPPPSLEDYAALEASIIESGVRVPVEYDEHGNILDGHTRVEICEKLGLWDYPKVIRKGLTEDEKRSHARQLNCARRHLTSAQKSSLIEDQLRDTPSISDRAIAAMLSVTDKTVGKVRKRLVDGAEIPHHEVREGRDGVKQSAVKTFYVPDTHNEKNYLSGAKAIRTKRMQTARDARLGLIKTISEAMPKGEAAALPKACFPVIYCDVPWKNEVYDEETGNDKPYPYPPMTLKEINALFTPENSPAMKDCVIFFWATANRVDLAIDILRNAGFTVKSQIIWDKVNQGTGRWVFDCHEVLIIATRGNIPAPVPGTQMRSIYREAKAEHSRKPVRFAQMIQDIYPDLPKLEMFQRAASLEKDDVRLNGQWTFWGAEAGGAQ